MQVDACYALEFLSSGTEEYIELAVPLVPKLFLLLSTGTEKLVRPSLRVLGNFATASNSQTQVTISYRPAHWVDRVKNCSLLVHFYSQWIIFKFLFGCYFARKIKIKRKGKFYFY